MKNKTFLQSILCAIKGLLYALKTEKNYKYYLIIIAISTIMNIKFSVSNFTYAGQLLSAIGVFASESLNTSIEHLSNKVDSSVNDEIKIVKDVAASSILCWGIAYFTIEIMGMIKFI